jgi:hypothetical protein
MKKYWYFITYYVCVVCGREEEHRERRYGERPENPIDRHEIIDELCGNCKY